MAALFVLKIMIKLAFYANLFLKNYLMEGRNVMVKLLLVRHGETVDNVNKIMQGQTQGELTEKGRIQAKELGEKLADMVFDAFFRLTGYSRAADGKRLLQISAAGNV